MKKFKFVILLGFAFFSSVLPVYPQDSSVNRPTSITANSSEREQDGLNGPVRRVRVETAKIEVKEGKPIEGARVVRGVTTYDVEGRRVDAVAYPGDNSALVGKEQYRYDDKGNIVEMVLRSDNGTILGKETYQYEFDELGNWKKMITSVAVYENGKLGFEPMEVTYRTITYYYSQAIDKLERSTAANASASSRSPANRTAPKKGDNVKPRTPVTTQEPVAAVPLSGNAGNGDVSKRSASDQSQSLKNNAQSAPSTETLKESSPLVSSTETVKKTAQPVSTPVPTPETVSEASSRTPSNPVTTETAKNNPPQPAPTPTATPETPSEPSGRTTSSAATTTETIKNNPAQPAPTPVPTPETGNAPGSRTSPLSNTSETARNNPAQVVPAPVKALETPNTSSNSPAATTMAPTRSSEAASFYERGLSYLKTGKNGEAIEALKQAVFLNPEDALACAKLGLAYAASGQHKDALAAFKLALKIKPEVADAEVYYRMAEGYSATGKNSEALKAYKQALYIKRAETADGSSTQAGRFPTMADLYFGLGFAYYNMESYSDAIKELKQAAALDPTSAEAHYGLALSYLGNGDRGGAQKEEKLLRPLNAGLADNIVAALANVLPKGVTRIQPREDRRTRP